MGAQSSDSERKTYYLNCKIRKCAMINAIDNCAYCNGFPCEELLKAHSVQQITPSVKNSSKRLAKKYPSKIIDSL